MVDPDSDRVSRAPPYSGTASGSPLHFAYAAFTLSDAPSQKLLLLISFLYSHRSPTTPLAWFGLLPFRSPLLGESLLISVPGLLRWFTSPSVTSAAYFIQLSGFQFCWRVTPFGYLRVNGYVLLPAAFRSLSRPSSSYGSIGIRHRPVFHLTILLIPPRAPDFPQPFLRQV